MEFKKCVAGKYAYGVSNPQRTDFNGITNVNFEDNNFDDHMKDNNHENYDSIWRFIEILGVCHTVIVDKKDDKAVYNASSPDELALVNAAKLFRFEFKDRDDDNNIIIDHEGTEIKY
jgi:phospholipid-transporting ATPase